jgi:TetR/AcrR family transcriptional regulator
MASLTDDDAPNEYKILEAGIEEFAKFGLAAARVDEIARRAGVSKQLLYYYYGSKSGLYDAAIKAMIRTYQPHWAGLESGDAATVLAHDLDFNIADPEQTRQWRRLLAWEGIEYAAAEEKPEIRMEQFRKEAYALHDGMVQRAIDAGVIKGDLDPRMVTLLVALVHVAPDVFPQITKMITGLSPDDRALRVALKDTLWSLLTGAGRDMRD